MDIFKYRMFIICVILVNYISFHITFCWLLLGSSCSSDLYINLN